MSQSTVQFSPPTGSAKPAKTFVHHAKLISAMTLLSRLLGMLRESIAARYYGAGLVSNAFAVAFTVPNLFRRLFGEGALSAAFIPLYSQSLKSGDATEARRFAAASVNLLIVILLALTIAGELILLGIGQLEMRPEYRLAVRLTAIMLPYVLLVCGTAFLGAILQVHRRFGLVAACPIVLNIGLIAGTLLGAWLWDMREPAGQQRAIYLVSCLVLVAGIAQVGMLAPSLYAIGFRFDLRATFWTPAVRRMLSLSIPAALGAGVLQLSVLLDRGLSFFLAQGYDQQKQLITHFDLFGFSIRYPMEYGAAARLAWAQYLYQFPLGVFAIALATAIFPTLSADAMEKDHQRFREGLRRGMQVTLWEGLAAGVGLMIVAYPAVQLLFERGQFTSHDTELVARSVRLYSIAIWAFSLQQILNRAYYALHDTMTPMLMSLAGLVVEMVIKLPLLWTGLGESGMAAGTAVSYSMQSLAMLWLLQRKSGSLQLKQMRSFVLKLLVAAALMAGACWLVRQTPIFPDPDNRTRLGALWQLVILVGTGAVVYLGACSLMGIGVWEHIRPKKSKPAVSG